MSELYLILHKVRGEPAFDIAQKMEMTDDEPWWIIPTSGHRAYPIQWTPMQSLGIAMVEDHPKWDSLPDHYSVTRDKTTMLDKLRAAIKFKPLVPLRRL